MCQHNLLGPHSQPRTQVQPELAGINCLGWKDAAFIKLFNRYFGWRNACINRFNRGSMRLISIVVKSPIGSNSSFSAFIIQYIINSAILYLVRTHLLWSFSNWFEVFFFAESLAFFTKAKLFCRVKINN